MEVKGNRSKREASLVFPIFSRQSTLHKFREFGHYSSGTRFPTWTIEGFVGVCMAKAC